jgi:hypothetical protein
MKKAYIVLEAISKLFLEGRVLPPAAPRWSLPFGLRAIGDPASGVTRPLQEVLKPLLCVFLINLFWMTVSWAAPAYGTRLPEKSHVCIGGQSYYVLERKLEQGHGEMNSLQHFLLISYGLTDWLSVDLKGGAGNIRQKPDIGHEIEYPSYVGGGYGFRLKFYEKEKKKAVFGFQHISIHPYTQVVGDTKHKAVLDNWQISWLASHEFAHAVPYAGMKWSRMDNIHWVDEERGRERSDIGKSIGFILGADIPFGRNMWMNMEGQVWDDQALAVSLNVQF